MSGHHDSALTPEQLAKVKDEDIDFSDIPELDEEFWERAELVELDRAGQHLGQGSRGVRQDPAAESPLGHHPLRACRPPQVRTDPADSSSSGRRS